MMQASLAALAPLVLVLTVGQASLTGEWTLEFTTPRGHAEYTMYLTHEGPRLNGHLTSEYGEIMLKGTVNGDEVTISWSQAESGKTMDITLTGTVKGEAITGTARLGTVGEGPFRAERTGGD
jgi:hypothetical protein